MRQRVTGAGVPCRLRLLSVGFLGLVVLLWSTKVNPTASFQSERRFSTRPLGVGREQKTQRCKEKVATCCGPSRLPFRWNQNSSCCKAHVDHNIDDSHGSSASTVTTTSPFETERFLANENDNVRAGTDGYSVLRQPASRTNWDPTTDPIFEVPSSDRDDHDGHAILEDWWQNNAGGGSSSKSPQMASGNKFRIQSPVEQNKRSYYSAAPTATSSSSEFNLLQRSWNTLDFPRLLQALQDECTTIPARKKIRQAVEAVAAARSSANRSKPSDVATRPLLATTVQGCQERYRAVQEMSSLLLIGDANIGRQRQDSSFYRNRLGQKQELWGRPPPLAGNAFAIEDLLSLTSSPTSKGGGRADTTKNVNKKILEGSEIWEIVSVLNTMEDVLLWSQGLERINSDYAENSQANGASSNDDKPPFVELPKIANEITVNQTLQELLHTAFEKDGQRLSGTTFPTIGRLRARIRALKADIMATLDSLVASPAMQSRLSLDSGGPLYSEVSGGRLVIPIDASQKASSVGIVHDSSRSGKTLYVEPTEIVEPTNELRRAEGELRAEEARVWRLLTEEIMLNRPTIEKSVEVIGQLDLVMARIALGQRLRGVIPVVEDVGVISLQNAKHPVLLLLRTGEDGKDADHNSVVGSDVELGNGLNQGLVLTGPNAGGKTVILKLLGLVALMARAGIPVPAAASSPTSQDYRPRVDFFDPVLADIGDLQSVGSDLSTFSGHMLVCREVLSTAGRNALVLMDELGSGTDPAQGVAIAQAILEALLETGSRVAITTHYMELKQLAASDDRFSVGGMQFVNGRPTYKLLPGTVGESFALAVAERLQLPQRIIDRATELLDSETRQMGDLIRDLENQKALVDQQAAELEEKTKELKRLEFKMKEEQIRLEKKQLVARREEAKKFAQKLEEKEQILEDILNKLKSDPSRKIVAKSWDDIRFVKRDALNEAEKVPSVMVRQATAAAKVEEETAELVPIAEMREKPTLAAGDEVVVCRGMFAGKRGTIKQAKGKMVELLVNNVVVRLKLHEIALPNNGKAGGTAPKENNDGMMKPKGISKAVERAIAEERKSGRGSSSDSDSSSQQQQQQQQQSSTSGGLRMDYNTVDVRGCTFDAAKEKILRGFGRCRADGVRVAFVLHGHGSGGILKSKIRDWLRTERRVVQRYEPASQADGGDAFTRVELN